MYNGYTNNDNDNDNDNVNDDNNNNNNDNNDTNSNDHNARNTWSAKEIREEREVRLSDAKYGRWTKKVSREKAPANNKIDL